MTDIAIRAGIKGVLMRIELMLLAKYSSAKVNNFLQVNQHLWDKGFAIVTFRCP